MTAAVIIIGFICIALAGAYLIVDGLRDIERAIAGMMEPGPKEEENEQ